MGGVSRKPGKANFRLINTEIRLLSTRFQRDKTRFSIAQINDVSNSKTLHHHIDSAAFCVIAYIQIHAATNDLIS
ncbi:hypothetical protein Pcaca04_18180 [Pectobacterium carotovorum subsp. carotovorum]|nr:hypothetical protein Pcaca04_18180 [Pectobacterium carotovorum subsp. carotovorum]